MKGAMPKMNKDEMDLSLSPSEERFMSVIWKNEPINSTKLSKICLDSLGWKKSTVYTMLKKLEKKEFVKNEQSIVTATIPQKSFFEFESKNIVNTSFEGSLPAFVAAFVNGKTLKKDEADELLHIIKNAREE